MDCLRAEHLIHVRCELPAPNARELFEPLMAGRRLHLISLMDHTPGQGSGPTSPARTYYTGRNCWSDAKFEEEVRIAPQRRAQYAAPHPAWFADFEREHGIALATHHDTTVAHVDEAVALGAGMSEFRTTVVAARHTKTQGLATVAGAPDAVRGGSHSSNVSALELASEGLLDALSSDYVPGSLLLAASPPRRLAASLLRRDAGFSLGEAVGVVSRRPAQAGGLADRGAIAPGLRADPVRVKEVDGLPVASEVYVQGRRVV